MSGAIAPSTLPVLRVKAAAMSPKPFKVADTVTKSEKKREFHIETTAKQLQQRRG